MDDEDAAERACQRLWTVLDRLGEQLFLIAAPNEFSALDRLRSALGQLAQLDAELSEAQLTADGRYLLRVRLYEHDCGKGRYCPLLD